MSNPRAIKSLFMIIGLAFYAASIGNTHLGPTGDEQEGLSEIEKLPIPPGAIELKLRIQFPKESDGPFLSQPEGLAISPENQLFISDMINNRVYAFDLTGNPLFTFGRSGQGPGDLLRPASIACTKTQLIIREAGNMRFQFYDLTGKFMDGFKIFRTYTDFIADEDHIYTFPLLPVGTVPEKSSRLVNVLNLHGQLVATFGDPLDVNKQDFPWLNQAILTRGPGNDLWVAFKCFPIIRRYSLTGELRAEYQYDYAISAKKAALNKQRDIERSNGGGQPFYAYLVHSIYGTDKGVYLVDSTAGGRLLVFFMDNRGCVKEYYWARISSKGFACTGLIVQEDGVNKKFYILNASEGQVAIYSDH